MTDEHRFKRTLLDNTDKNFIRRMVDPKSFSVINNDDGTVSTHKMISAETDGRFISFPAIVQSEEGGELREIADPFKYAMNTGEFIEFSTEEEAEDFAKGGWKDVFAEQNTVF